MREKRYQRCVALGLIDPSTSPLGPKESGKSGADCEDKAWEAKHMEAHAAMVDRLDQGVGRLIAKLKATGEYDNTLILFLADNGASPERGYKPGFDRPGHTRAGEEIIYPHQKYERPGAEKTWGYLGDAWAGAVNAPFRYWKKESYEGGICTPFIVHWPAGLAGKENTLNSGFGHVMDILPTCLELTGATYPDQIHGQKTTPPMGRSIWPLLQNEITTTHDTLFWEHVGGKAARVGNWKIAALKDQPWELFDLAKDRTETRDLAAKYPEKVGELSQLWEVWMEEMMKEE